MYKKLKGDNNADPKIVVKLSQKSTSGQYSPQSDFGAKLGPVNQRTFSVTIDQWVWLHTGMNGLDVSLYDDDTFGGGYLMGVNFVDLKGKSTSREWRSDDGSSLSIYYKME